MNDKILKFLAISNSGGGSSSQPNIQELNITQNGTYEAQGNVDGYNPVIVNVSGGEPEPPDDGKTRLYITVPANSMPGLPPPRNEVPLYIQQYVDNGVTIDWGDGSDPEIMPGIGNVNTTHTYQTAGDFVISLDPAEGCDLGLGYGGYLYCVMGPISNNERVYCTMLQRAVIGSRGSRGITRIRNYSFQYCYSLASMTIPDGVTSIGDRAFYYCYSLASMTIPDGVTSIGARAFQYCYGVKEYHLLATTPPSLSNVSAFEGIPSDCIIYVPVGSLEAYQTATNWSTYADQMREEGT